MRRAGFPTAPGKIDHELLTAEARECVALAEVALRQPADGLQHPIAHGMAVARVELAEEIDVEHDCRQRHIVACGQCKLVLQHLREVVPVIEPGQVISQGDALQRLVRLVLAR